MYKIKADPTDTDMWLTSSTNSEYKPVIHSERTQD